MPETERVSQPPPPRHTLDLTSLVQSALEGIRATNTPCEEDMLFNEAVCVEGLEYGAVLSVQYYSFFSLLYTYYFTFTILWLVCPFNLTH